MRRNERIIYALPEGNGHNVYIADAAVAPIPFAAITITSCAAEDAGMMRRWIQRRLNRRWSIDKIRRLCEVF